MGKKKKKDVVRCMSCGVQATKQIASDLHVCDNPACEVVARQHMVDFLIGCALLGIWKQE